MAIKRYESSKTATISNAFKPGLLYRATGSNTGLADSMEIFHIYGQASSASGETSRALVEFPISSISTDRTSKIIPKSGSVSFFLNLYNAEHPFTLPRNFYLAVVPVSRSWDQGYGVDLDEYTDDGIVNWNQASSGSSGIVNWSNAGGDYWSASYSPGVNLPGYSYYFLNGTEDISIDVTSYIEEIIAGTYPNYGFLILLSGSESATSSSYTKKFYTQGSEYFFKRPVIQARWDSSKKDNRANFVVSSSLLSARDNTNTIYLYNSFRGQLKNLPTVDSGAIYIQVWDNISSSLTGSTVLLTPTPITGGCIETGIYTASFALNTTCSVIYDRWYDSSLTQAFHTGTIETNILDASDYNPNPKYVISMPDIKCSYNQDETARLRLFTRKKDWSPNIYTVINSTPETEIVEDVYYQIKRVTDDLIVLDYGTGSVNHTRLSYDVSGSYFDLDMSFLETGYMYAISFAVKLNNTFQEQSQTFKFRVD